MIASDRPHSHLKEISKVCSVVMLFIIFLPFALQSQDLQLIYKFWDDGFWWLTNFFAR